MNKKYFSTSIFVTLIIFGFGCSPKNGAAPTPTDKSQQATATVTTTDTATAPTLAIVVAEEQEEETPLDPKDIGTPMQAIKDLDKRVEGYNLGQNLTAEQLEENKMLRQKIIRGTFDIKELCRLSLGKHWDEIKEEQRKGFVDLMGQLLETKALFSKDQLHGENKLYSIQYQKEVFDDAEKKKATVTTKMIVTKDHIDFSITYKLLLTPYGWKIFDVIVDDSSLLTNYKLQFDRIIVKSGYDDLIGRMQNKLKDINGEM